MEDLLRSKGLYKITLGIEDVPIEESGKVDKWKNKNDQARGLIGMSISPDIDFISKTLICLLKLGRS